MEIMPLSIDAALALGERLTLDELCDEADRVRRELRGNVIHTCSIVNARSGRCPEDCHWCAQSAHYNTGCREYPVIDRRDLFEAYDRIAARGVERFSLVTSGRRVMPSQMPGFCELFRELSARGPVKLCASMGLLTREHMRMLREAGVTRYHCNLEAAESLFSRLCTTHTRADKLATIRAAIDEGMSVCVGGIIGMGESMRQRLELAVEAREAGARSIPVNILCPIAGTPLEGQPPLSDEEIIRSVALMRLVAPDCDIFFAGGRAGLSRKTVRRMLRGGADGAMVCNMLTVAGNDIDDDFALFSEAGYRTPPTPNQTPQYNEL